MGKRQTLTFSKPGITNLADMTMEMADDMNDPDFVQYVRSLTIPVDYYWDDSTNEMTVVRIWNEDSDYNEYLSTWGASRDATEQNLINLGYTLTEEVEDL